MNSQSKILFIYGTLTDPDVLQLVLNRNLSSLMVEYVVIEGFKLEYVKGESFPMMVKGHGSIVNGKIIQNLSAADFDRLRFFEGDEYSLEMIGEY